MQPEAAVGPPPLGKPADILKFPLIHLDSRADWTHWLRAAGVDEARVTHGPVLNRASMVIDAAINGQGIALARTTLAAWDLINGRLVRPFPDSLPLSKTYWIICPKATSGLPKIVTFRELAAGGGGRRCASAQAGAASAALELICPTWRFASDAARESSFRLEKRVRRKTDFASHFNLIWAVQVPA